MTHIRVIWKGTLPGGESWSTSAAFIPVGVVTVPQPQAAMNAGATAIAAAGLSADILSMISQATALTEVRLEQRTASGALRAVGVGARSNSQVGSTTPTKPFQTSVVVSLRTQVPGKRGRGRMYWPALGLPISASTLRVSPTDVNAKLNAIKALMVSTQGILQTNLGDVPHVLAVYSKVGALETEVNAMEMGDVLDVQRRRRDKAVENRVTTPYG